MSGTNRTATSRGIRLEAPSQAIPFTRSTIARMAVAAASSIGVNAKATLVDASCFEIRTAAASSSSGVGRSSREKRRRTGPSGGAKPSPNATSAPLSERFTIRPDRLGDADVEISHARSTFARW